jgi:FkbM family methyltransferase
MSPPTIRKALGSVKRYVLSHTFLGARRRISELQQEIIELRRNLVETNHDALHRVGTRMNGAVIHAILHSSPDAHFECILNGAKVVLPRDTLDIMRNCIHAQIDAPFIVEAELAHQRWLLDKLKPGDVFLDVGAATGAMTVPIAKTAPNVRIIAFEPNRTANRALRETLRRNDIACAEVIDQAVTDENGTATFFELKFDPTGKFPFMPEASSIATAKVGPEHISETYEVSTTTLDDFFAARGDCSAVRSVKIDVEGFEILVLMGAKRFLSAVRPFIAVDIHLDPSGEELTEPGVRACLEPHGYRFENLGHVLLCYPLGA